MLMDTSRSKFFSAFERLKRRDDLAHRTAIRLPAAALALDRASLEVYGYDNSKRHHAADAVVFAHSIELAELFSLVLQLRGTLSGEHGIGLDKLAFVTDAPHPGALSLMHAIKAQFDPHGILNPGKVLP